MKEYCIQASLINSILLKVKIQFVKKCFKLMKTLKIQKFSFFMIFLIDCFKNEFKFRFCVLIFSVNLWFTE